jgi:hypothetical protein
MSEKLQEDKQPDAQIKLDIQIIKPTTTIPCEINHDSDILLKHLLNDEKDFLIKYIHDIAGFNT